MIDWKKILPLAALVVIALFAAVSVVRIFSKGGQPGIDFHLLLWYPGHFIWQGKDPYNATLTGEQLQPPIHYWDGQSVTQGQVAQFDWGAMPTNTAPVLLLLAWLSRFSWTNALLTWRLIGVALIFTIAWLLARLLHHNPLSWKGLFLVSILFSLTATREALEYGQTTLLVLCCMLAAVLWGRKSPLAAGVLLGIALSKYSLTFPAALLFLYKRWYKSFLIAVLTQVMGVIVIAAIGGSSPWAVVTAYLRLMTPHLNMDGMHLSAGLLSGFGPFSIAILLAGSVALWAGLFWWRRGYIAARSQVPDDVCDFNLLTIVMFWNLLVFPHRRYDNVASILLVALVLFSVHRPGETNAYRGVYSLSLQQRRIVYVITVLVCLVWILPIYTLMGNDLYRYLFNVSTAAALATSFWLLLKWKPWASASKADLVRS